MWLASFEITVSWILKLKICDLLITTYTKNFCWFFGLTINQLKYSCVHYLEATKCILHPITVIGCPSFFQKLEQRPFFSVKKRCLSSSMPSYLHPCISLMPAFDVSLHWCLSLMPLFIDASFLLRCFPSSSSTSLFFSMPIFFMDPSLLHGYFSSSSMPSFFINASLLLWCLSSSLLMPCALLLCCLSSSLMPLLFFNASPLL